MTDPHWTAGHEDDIRTAWREGQSASLIAQRYGVTRSAACGWLFRQGLKREGKQSTMWMHTVNRAPRPARVRPPRPVVEASQPRPWEDGRKYRIECAFLLDDGLACCAPTTGRVKWMGAYCRVYVKVMAVGR